MSDADLLLDIAVVVASVLACTTVFSAGWYQGRKRAYRDIKVEVDNFGLSVDRKIALATARDRGLTGAADKGLVAR